MQQDRQTGDNTAGGCEATGHGASGDKSGRNGGTGVSPGQRHGGAGVCGGGAQRRGGAGVITMAELNRIATEDTRARFARLGIDRHVRPAGFATALRGRARVEAQKFLREWVSRGRMCGCGAVVREEE